MGMVIIRHQGYTFHAPESWVECNQTQLASLYPCTHLKKEDLSEDIRKMVAQVWLGATDKEWAAIRLTRFQWEELQKQFDWVFHKPTGKIVDNFTHEGQTLYLPEDDFENTSSLELAMAMMYWTQFAHPTDADKTALDKLIATLCRAQRPDSEAWQNHPDFDGDLRLKYNEVNSLRVATSLETLPMGIKILFLDYFNSMAESFLDNYEEVFGSSGKDEPLYDDGRGWLMLLKDVAKEGHFGTFDAVCRQPAHLMFTSILDDTLKAQRQQQQQKDLAHDNY